MYRNLQKQKTCRVVQTSVWMISYSGELCNKNCVIETTKMLIIYSTVCYNSESDKLVCNERVTRLTGKKSSDDYTC